MKRSDRSLEAILKRAKKSLYVPVRTPRPWPGPPGIGRKRRSLYEPRSLPDGEPCTKPKLNYPGSAYDLTLQTKLRRYRECLKRRYGK